jgi:hypothetical protein
MEAVNLTEVLAFESEDQLVEEVQDFDCCFVRQRRQIGGYQCGSVDSAGLGGFAHRDADARLPGAVG